MIEKFTIRKIIISALLILVAIILYNYPENLKEHISNSIEKKEDIFLIDKNNYVSMTKMISKSENTNERIEEIIYSLIIDSSYKYYLPKDFKAIIPKNTKLLDYSLENNLLKINFSKEFLNVEADDEEKMIQSIIFSLTNIKEVKKIMIFVEGEHLTQLPHSKKKIDLYLDRSFGINTIYDINTFNNTDYFTVYYLNKNDEYYYTPITYVENDVEDKVELIIKNLTTTPTNGGSLISRLNYQVELMNYDLTEEEIIMNFNTVLLNSVANDKLLEEVKYSIYYSLNDSLGIKKVIFEVDNEKIDDLGLEN